MDSVEQLALISWMESNLFHFSCKTVNSNAQAGGVRLGAEQVLDLPYISARALLAEQRVIGLDYLGAAQMANKFTQVRSALGEVEESKPIDSDAKRVITEKYHQLGLKHGEKGLDVVSPRLRQLLIPKKAPTGSDEYVAITPLGSSGLCEMVQSVLKQRKALREAESPTHQTTGFDPIINQLSVGGSKPQNVGGRVRAMSSPLVFVRVPQQNPEVRKALSLAYRGFRPRLPRPLVVAYAQWLQKLRDADHKMTFSLHEQESALVRPMFDAIRTQAIHAARLLAEHSDDLPENTGEDTLLQSWLSPDTGNAGARAQWLVSTLSGYRLNHVDGEQDRLILSPEDARRLTVLIEEIR